jgi:hypothetical protein
VSENLVELATRYLRLAGELDATRDAMKKLLMNGAEPPPVNPPSALRPGVKRSQPNHPNAIMASEAEAKILELLKTRPMRMAEIAAEMEAKQTTTSLRWCYDRGADACF